jgi:hypothetical protein
MTTETLELALNPLQAGWYYDPDTGQWYYYDEEGKRYFYAAGLFYPMMEWEPAPKVVNVRHGDTLRISVSFKYSGPSKTCKLYGSVGQKYSFSVFDEILKATSPSFTLDESTTPKTYIKQVDIAIIEAIAAGKSYGIYAKLIDGIGFKERVTGSVALEDAIFVVSAEPTFADFEITDYAQV